MPSFTATIMFYIPNYDAAVKFAQAPQHELLIMTGWDHLILGPYLFSY